MKYNKQQEEAVMHKDGAMLVLAGPGCGKTAVITGRLNNLINIGVSPSSILVVTFTRAAAGEMKERFLRLRSENGSGDNTADDSKVSFGTFHGVFYHILRNELRLDSNCILGEEQKFLLLKNILESCSADEYFEKELTKNVIQEISYIKGNGISSKNFYSSALPEDTFRKVYGQYRLWLTENRKLDFDDINTLTYRLFKTKDDALKRWQKRFKYILIDEFQDINPIQYRIIRMIAEPENNIFIVGDDDQSIYRFRGSDPSIMLGFPRHYKDSKIVRLVENYRSTPEILKAASTVISCNKKRFSKELFTSNNSGKNVDIEVFDNIWQETDILSKNIRDNVSSGKKYSDMAILVRTNFGARAAIEKLIYDRIPFEAQQDIPCIFDHFIAKDMITYMKIGNGSDKREDYLKIINKPNRFISRNAFYEKNVRFESLYFYYEDREWMWKRIEELEENIRVLKDLPPYGAIHYIRKVIGYDEYIRDYALEKKVPAKDLFDLIDEITESARPFKTFDEWQKHILEYSENIKKHGKNQTENTNTVKITTLHGSKGKEYDIVYILDVNDGVIPFHKANLEQDIEEERRLFYVGMTRAKEQLNIYAVKERYEKKTDISPFIKNLI